MAEKTQNVRVGTSVTFQKIHNIPQYTRAAAFGWLVEDTYRPGAQDGYSCEEGQKV